MDELKDIEKLEALADSLEVSDSESDDDTDEDNDEEALETSVDTTNHSEKLDTGQGKTDDSSLQSPNKTELTIGTGSDPCERSDENVKVAEKKIQLKLANDDNDKGSAEKIQLKLTDDNIKVAEEKTQLKLTNSIEIDKNKKVTSETISMKTLFATSKMIDETRVDDEKESEEDLQESVEGKKKKEKLTELFLSVDKVVMSYAEEENEAEEDDSEHELSDDEPSFMKNDKKSKLSDKSEKPDRTEEDMEDDYVEGLQLGVDDEASYLDMEVDNLDNMEEEETRNDEDVEGHDNEDVEEHDDEDQHEDEEEDEDEDEELDDDELEPNLDSLEFLNTNYKDYLKHVLTELTQQLSQNQRRQQEINILLEAKEDQLKKIQDQNENKHIAISRRALTVFGYPYFKDDQMFYPPPNKDVIKKRERKELDNWIEYPRAWTPEERRTLLKACRTEARYKRFHQLYDEKEDLERQLKAIGITDYEKELVEDKLLLVKHNIRQCVNINDIELFGDRNEEFDWMKICKVLQGVHDEVECRLQWANLVHPSINRSPWSMEEDELLKKLAEATDCREWDEIAQEMGLGRTAITCFQRFMQKHIPVKNIKKWSSREDDRLLRLVQHCRVNYFIPWGKIHYYMPGRTKDQCNQRFMNSLRDGIRMGAWSEAEEWLLIAGEILYNGDGHKVGELMPTRSNMQIHCHWHNYMKGSFRPWTNEEDILLLESVKKYGVKNWVAVAEVFNDEARNRARCRHRFEGIYRIFKKYPANRLDCLADLTTNKYASKRREKHFQSFEKKFKEWAQNMKTEPVISNIPLVNVDMNAKTILPNHEPVENRILSKFIRHLQTLLPPLLPIKPGILPKLQWRRFPDQQLEPLPTRPLSLTFIKSRLRKKMVARKRKQLIKIEGVHFKRPKMHTPLKSLMDHKLSRLFRPTLVAHPGRYKVNHSEDELAALSITAKNLDTLLDFSSVKSNIDEITISKFSRGEQKILENYRFHSDITDAQISPPLENASPSKLRTTYRNRRKRRRSKDTLKSSDSEVSEPTDDTELVNMIPPNSATLNLLRGALLHADYTAEIARHIESDARAASTKNTKNAVQRVLSRGVANNDLMRRFKVGNTLFSSLSDCQVPDFEVNSEQVAADRKLVERLLKLIYLPGKMSLHMPDDLEDVFGDVGLQGGSCTESDDTQLDASYEDLNGTPGEDNSMETSIEAPSPLKLRKLSSLQDQPLNLSMDNNVPSVMSIYSDFGTPATPATRTYARKKKADHQVVSQPVLKLAFNELLSKENKNKTPRKMSEILKPTVEESTPVSGPAPMAAPSIVPQENMAPEQPVVRPSYRLPIFRSPTTGISQVRPQGYLIMQAPYGTSVVPNPGDIRPKAFRFPFPIAPNPRMEANLNRQPASEMQSANSVGSLPVGAHVNSYSHQPSAVSSQNTGLAAGPTVVRLAGGATLIRKQPGAQPAPSTFLNQQPQNSVSITRQPADHSGAGVVSQPSHPPKSGATAQQRFNHSTGKSTLSAEQAAQLVLAGHQVAYTATLMQQPGQAAAARHLAARAEFARQQAAVAASLNQRAARIQTRMKQQK